MRDGHRYISNLSMARDNIFNQLKLPVQSACFAHLIITFAGKSATGRYTPTRHKLQAIRVTYRLLV